MAATSGQITMAAMDGERPKLRLFQRFCAIFRSTNELLLPQMAWLRLDCDQDKFSCQILVLITIKTINTFAESIRLTIRWGLLMVWSQLMSRRPALFSVKSWSSDMTDVTWNQSETIGTLNFRTSISRLLTSCLRHSRVWNQSDFE